MALNVSISLWIKKKKIFKKYLCTTKARSRTSSRICQEFLPKPDEECISVFGQSIPEVVGNHGPLYEVVILSCCTGLHVVEGNISCCHDTIRLENIPPLWLILIHRIDCEYCTFRICNYFILIRIFYIIFRNSLSYVSYKEISLVQNHY